MLKNFTITQSACDKAALIIKNNNSHFFRIKVSGGGCSGFQYIFELADKQEKDDILLSKPKANFLIDEISTPFLEDCTFDYKQQLIGEGFAIDNPHATASCGCGVSFSF